ncbi:MAG: HAMP domain-containing protein [Proteobacteria bacterium]|nr:HAMP domain-containing protein [Pseudomonadota bacterium]
MKIRSKVTALIAGIFVILGVAAILVGKFVIMPSFAELERADAHTAMRRVSYALELTLDRMALSAIDWGNWADTYRFASDHNPGFVAANITDVTLKQLNANVLMMVDVSGNVVLSQDRDLVTDQPLGVDFAALKSLPATFPWKPEQLLSHAARGLVRTDRGLMMLVAAPILNGDARGPVHGMVILGRLLSGAPMESIAAQVQLPVAILPPGPSSQEESITVGDENTRVVRTLDDIYGRPLLALSVDVPREVSMRGKAAVKVALACLIAAAVLVLILLAVVLNRVILNPLALMTRHAVEMGQGTDLTTRLDLRRSDEMGVLAREFDNMVERVAESRTQLVDQSFQAGFAELAKGVLHNLGNAMTPIGVRLANLGERLRDAPAEDAELAVAELAQKDVDAERRADLQEFLRLACKELSVAVRNAREDVTVMSRQTTGIQTVLSEQLRSARNEHVIEPVRLTELVAQSLDSVPDSCRQRLTIDTDETLRGLGVVRIARTVMRLILQNLIINAADAVRDAGKDKGRLRLSAQIEIDATGQQLHLQCKDDGVGIPPQNLQRVFEKGFSTKSPETNHGIGLHWCANAINALGGRIWAASEGPGRGASMHVIVPLAAN